MFIRLLNLALAHDLAHVTHAAGMRGANCYLQ